MKQRPRVEDGKAVVLGDDARNRFYGSSGYGRPTETGLRLSFVEAAHLLRRGKIDDVEGKDFVEFTEYATGSEVDFTCVFRVYSDLRERGYYLQHRPGEETVDVYPRGKLPSETSPKEEVRVTDERGEISAEELVEGEDGVIGVVDSEGDVTYFRTETWDTTGKTELSPETSLGGRVVGDRVVVEEEGDLHESSFYGSVGSEGLFLSPVEAVYLDNEGVVSLSDEDRRKTEKLLTDGVLKVYSDLRDRGLCPKTGFKFGTEFRVYETVTDVEDLPHSEYVVDVVSRDRVFGVREISRAVRLAHGVRKEMVFGVVGEGVEYVGVSRYRP